MTAVTLIIPVYNRSAYLPRLFRSIEAIDYDALHVILVDNGSVDHSLELCREYGRQSKWPVQVVEETRKGASCARNAGLEACQTEWCYFFDSDDELSKDFLTQLVPLTNQKDVVFLPTIQIENEESTVRAYRPTGDAGYQILSSMLNSPAMLFRTDWLRGIGGWNDSLTVWDDWELGVRTLLAQPRSAWYTAKAFHRLYVHDDSITGDSMSHNLEGKIQCLKTVRDQLYDNKHQRALFLRTCIFEGYLRREGCMQKVEGFDAGITWPYKCLGQILSAYVKRGGRGAWRMACWLC